ncbi:hypothetical protein [Paraburkholderia sediminicola]|uniref:hypothetical protein n=1 Tax=Paraburkholderia sediminicola TaxID=458836 RepID=UPI0038BAFF8A
MRLSYAHDQGKYAIACDDEANLHYRTEASRIWSARCYVSGSLKGLIEHPLPDWFIDSWFVEIVVPPAEGHTEPQSVGSGTSDGASW